MYTKKLMVETKVDGTDQNTYYVSDGGPLLPTLVGYACTPVSLGNLCGDSNLPTFRHIYSSDRVQAWPKPLNGAGLFQNLHQIAAGETVQNVDEPAHEDAQTAFQVADKDTASTKWRQSAQRHGWGWD